MRNAKWMLALAGAVALALTATPMFADGGANHQVKQTPPVQMGTSGGSLADHSNAFCCGGTLGSLITRDGTTYILSNNHVLARSGSATTGETDIQPGLIDKGCSQTLSNYNVVGTFAGNIVPLGTANVDVGLSVANANVDGSGSIIDIGVPSCVTAAASGNVTKSGRTTGQTFGTVQATNVNVSISYQKGCNSGKKFTITYSNQVSITPGTFSGGGDSGSLIVTDNASHNPVALLYAGSSSVTIGNPVADVLAALNAGGHTTHFVGSGSCTGTTPIGVGVESANLLHGPSANDIDFARTIKERYEPDLFAKPGVIGAGVGKDDIDPTKAVIILYVENAGGSRAHGLPTDLEGVKVKVIETDPFVAR
ncbi:MAG: hypothetical protein HY049_15720 [Acidobacteria bacterium]|nr:hypothetical protein [Acidobacteriota bacterium]